MQVPWGVPEQSLEPGLIMSAAPGLPCRSLPKSEYLWWREYISAPAYHEGVKRRYMLERLWQVR